jgi:hypothetical protein
MQSDTQPDVQANSQAVRNEVLLRRKSKPIRSTQRVRKIVRNWREIQTRKHYVRTLINLIILILLQ